MRRANTVGFGAVKKPQIDGLAGQIFHIWLTYLTRERGHV